MVPKMSPELLVTSYYWFPRLIFHKTNFAKMMTSYGHVLMEVNFLELKIRISHAANFILSTNISEKHNSQNAINMKLG